MRAAFNMNDDGMFEIILSSGNLKKVKAVTVSEVGKKSGKTFLMADAKQKWHPADKLPPLHEESFEDDDEVIRSMVSDPVLVLLEGGNVKIAQFDHSKHGDYWFDDYGTVYNQSITYWMPLPERPEE